MADYKDLPDGRQDPVYTHDEANGTFSRSSAAHLRGWDTTDGAWNRVPVDHTTGSLLVKATLAAGSVDIGIVDQGTGGSSAWKVTDAALADGTQKTKLIDTGGTNVATVSAAGRLAVDASGVAVPVTDNSGSLTVDAPVGTPVAARLSDGAAFYDAAKTGQLPAALVGGRLDENVGAWLGSTAPTVGQKAMASSVPVVLASDQSAVGVTPPTLTKGTQAATGFSVQDLKDSGRVNIAWTIEVAGAATTEALATVTESRDGAATTTFTSKVVTSGKRLRITSVQMAVETLGTGTAPQRVYLRMRFNTAGAATTASPLQGTWTCANNPAVVKTATSFAADFPDGIEYLGDGTKQIGFTLTFPDWVVTTATVQAKVTITAFEY